jgi:4-amino-4-deoxy-L-arabinose transferase-like glycosyltransferase
MTAEPGTGRRRSVTRWELWLALWTLVGLAIRVATVLGRPHRQPGGDALIYHTAANVLADGKGFINPLLWYGRHEVVQYAGFPPGFIVVLAAASVVGLKSYFAQRIWCCIIGAAVVAVCGWTGREIAGPRVGLITAFLVAVYPNIWMNDEIAMSETLSPLLVAIVLLTAYRFWRKPSLRRAVWLGLSVGLAALVRDELALLGLFVLTPMVLTASALTWRRRILSLGVGLLCAVVVVAPWVGYNMSRFSHPVFISAGLGPTLASTDCAGVFYGPNTGYWSYPCAQAAPTGPSIDESAQSAAQQSYALNYIRSHENRIIPVVAARLGRAFGLFHPIQQIRLDKQSETRPYHWALLGLWMYYGLAVLSVVGAVLLRRRKIPIFPLVGIGLTVAISVVLTFGDTRYRTAFEVALVILPSVTVDWLWSRVSSQKGSVSAEEGNVPPERRPSVLAPPG